MKAHMLIETERLLLRPPAMADARAIFERYASDSEVTRYVSFPRHRSLNDTRAFVEWSERQWSRWPAGPYLIVSKSQETLLGGTGLLFKTRTRAETGYVLARDAWGRGMATEVLAAMVELAFDLGVETLEAMCHPQHRASQRVLEKCGFELTPGLGRKLDFPNLEGGLAVDVLCFWRPPAG